MLSTSQTVRPSCLPSWASRILSSRWPRVTRMEPRRPPWAFWWARATWSCSAWMSPASMSCSPRRGRRLRLEPRARGGHLLSGEETGVGLPVDAADRQRAVAADSARRADGKRVAQRFVGDRLARRAFSVDVGGAASDQAAVRRAVVVLVEEREQADLHIVQGAAGADVIQAAASQGAPEALHLSAGLWIVGLGVDDGDAQPRARDLQRLAAIGGAVVEVQRLRQARASQRLHEQLEHVDLALGGEGADGDDVA